MLVSVLLQIIVSLAILTVVELLGRIVVVDVSCSAIDDTGQVLKHISASYGNFKINQPAELTSALFSTPQSLVRCQLDRHGKIAS